MFRQDVIEFLFALSDLCHGNLHITGQQGLKDCESLVDFVSEKLGIDKKEIAIASTGVIGRQMPMDIITDVADESISKLEHSAKSSHDCAEAIMTTDKIPKECAVEVTVESGEKVKIAGISKGSGMIAPLYLVS